jgi:hypothetical protein
VAAHYRCPLYADAGRTTWSSRCTRTTPEFLKREPALAGKRFTWLLDVDPGSATDLGDRSPDRCRSESAAGRAKLTLEGAGGVGGRGGIR